jgi:hypothetical protein
MTASTTHVCACILADAATALFLVFFSLQLWSELDDVGNESEDEGEEEEEDGSDGLAAFMKAFMVSASRCC